MKPFSTLMTGVAVSALLAGAAMSPAVAADVYSQGSYKDSPAVFSNPKVNWSGVYIGGRIGYGNANHDLSLDAYEGASCRDDNDTNFGAGSSSSSDNPLYDISPSGGIQSPKSSSDCTGSQKNFVAAGFREIANIDGLNSSGVIGGIDLGADIQRGRFVFGVFGNYNWSGMETSGSIGIAPGKLEGYLEKDGEWSLGVRGGILVNPKTLVYLLAAYTETEYNLRANVPLGKDVKDSNTFSGITVGTGVEYAVTNNIFLGLEYSHTFYGDEEWFNNCPSTGCVGYVGGFSPSSARIVDSLDEDRVMATIKMKLNSGLFGN